MYLCIYTYTYTLKSYPELCSCVRALLICSSSASFQILFCASLLYFLMDLHGGTHRLSPGAQKDSTCEVQFDTMLSLS